MLINLWVKDKHDGRIHQVGTDTHDAIEYLDGQVIYYNLQNSGSTLDIYEWVETPNLDDYVSVTPEQLHINRELVHRDLMKKLENEKLKKKIKELFKDVCKEESEVDTE